MSVKRVKSEMIFGSSFPGVNNLVDLDTLAWLQVHLGLKGEVEKTENNMKKYNNEMDTVFSLFIFYSLVTS